MKKIEDHPKCVSNFIKYFGNLGKSHVQLSEIYNKNIAFEDPIKKIIGLDLLDTYYKKLNSNVLEGKFDFFDICNLNTKYILRWVFNVKIKRPRKTIQLEGCSILKIKDNTIYYQRDYFDVGALVYEHIPIIGSLLKLMKKMI